MSDRKSHAKSVADSREALLMAGRRVFASKGYEGATVKDLADEAGVNVSLVSYHFGGKEGLYRTCLESFGQERVKASQRLLRPATTHEEFKLRLKIFGEEIIEINLRDSTADICRIVHRGMDTLDPISLDVFKNVFVRLFNSLHKFIASAQKLGLVKPSIDSEIAASLLFGSLMHMIRADRLSAALGRRTLTDPAFRQTAIEHWVEAYTSGIFSASNKVNP